jgi:hypothetical protein
LPPELSLELVVLASACGGCIGEDAFGDGVPAGARVTPGADDEGGVVVVVGEQVGLERGQVQGAAGVAGLGDQGLGAGRARRSAPRVIE